MPAYTINPNNAGTVSLALEGITPLVNYAAQVTEFALVPTPNLTTTPGTYGFAPFDSPGLSSWAIQISFLQDWGNTPSLSQFTFDNDGEPFDFEFEPTNPASAPKVSGTASIVATQFGGLPGEAWTVTGATWSCKEKPTVTASPTTLAASNA